MLEILLEILLEMIPGLLDLAAVGLDEYKHREREPNTGAAHPPNEHSLRDMAIVALIDQRKHVAFVRDVSGTGHSDADALADSLVRDVPRSC